MPDTTTRTGATKPIVGESGWGPVLRSALDTLDAAFSLTSHDHAGTYAPTAHSHGSTTLPWFDVRDTAFSGGALLNGVADDTNAIQAALDAVPTTGGIVFVPAGRAKISATLLVKNDNITLLGAGCGERVSNTQVGQGTRFEPTSAVTGAAIRVQRVANDRPVLGVLMKDFTIDGQSLGSAVDGLHYRSNRGLIENVAVYRMSGNGFHLQGYAGWSLYDTRLYGLQAGANAAAGFYGDTRAEDLHMTNCILFGNQDGARLQSASEQIVGCHFYDNTRYGVFFDAGGTRSKLLGCKVEGNKGGGARLETTSGNGMSGIQIIGCGFANNFDVTTNVIDDIYIGGDAATGCSGTQIIGNSFENKGGGGASVKARSCVNLVNNAAQGTQITANRFARSSASLHVGTEYVIDNGNTAQYLKSYIFGNQGLGTMASGFDRRGTAIITAAATSVTVTHGLDRTPNVQDIFVAPTNNPTNDPGNFYVTNVGATTFDISVRAVPGASTATFAWRAFL